mmetsp:Transcript_25967/g.82745  ORF Transcript_25967/g.82745 Transcript_25967/m.82745 type:complete len:285 (+) Transcript_25967:1778-2632(+)
MARHREGIKMMSLLAATMIIILLAAVGASAQDCSVHDASMKLSCEPVVVNQDFSKLPSCCQDAAAAAEEGCFCESIQSYCSQEEPCWAQLTTSVNLGLCASAGLAALPVCDSGTTDAPATEPPTTATVEAAPSVPSPARPAADPETSAPTPAPTQDFVAAPAGGEKTPTSAPAAAPDAGAPTPLPTSNSDTKAPVAALGPRPALSASVARDKAILLNFKAETDPNNHLEGLLRDMHGACLYSHAHYLMRSGTCSPGVPGAHCQLSRPQSRIAPRSNVHRTSTRL